MTFDPLRGVLGQAGRSLFPNESRYKVQAGSSPARDRAEAVEAPLCGGLGTEAESFRPLSPILLDRLVEVGNARKRVRENQSLEGLQRETNRLLRQSLIEQQLQSRAGEFEGRGFVRPALGGPPAPTLDSLLRFHETARQSGDEAALEWARRQLEGFRGRVTEPEDQRRIDLACDRPDRVNPRRVGAHVEAMRDQGVEALERFVSRALEERNASACMAAFRLARQAPEGNRLRWVRMVLNGLGQFPDVALSALRSEVERDARHSAEPTAPLGEPIEPSPGRRTLSAHALNRLGVAEAV